MRLRNTTVRAPEARVYTHEPRLHQTRFSDRLKAVRSLPTHQESRTPQLQKQQTLTQLDFDCASSSRSSRDLDPSDDDWEGCSRSRKRRRPNTTAAQEAEITRQNTLTQMRGFLQRGDQDIDTEEEDDSEMGIEHDTIGPALRRPSQSQREEPAWYHSFHEEDVGVFQVANLATSQSSMHLQRQNPKSSPAQIPPAIQSSSSSSTARNLKREVPSSQSPPASPLSTLAKTPMSSPAKSQRTPLSEIHPNILAQRDSMSPPKKPKTHHRQSVIQDSVCDDLDLDLDLAGDENSDPDEHLSLPCSPKKQQTYGSSSPLAKQASSYTLSPITPTETHIEQVERTSQASTLSMSPSPFKRPPLPPRAAAAATTAAEGEVATHSSPSSSQSPTSSTADADSPFKRPRLPPHALARRASGSSSLSPSPSPSPSPRSPHLTAQPLRQQHQQKQQQPQSPPSPKRPPPFTDSQWSVDVDSQLTFRYNETGDMSSLPTINDSADIVMASQLCPRSSVE